MLICVDDLLITKNHIVYIDALEQKLEHKLEQKLESRFEISKLELFTFYIEIEFIHLS